MSKKLPYLKFAKDVDKLGEGAEVFALGHPMGMAWTLTKGIVSSNERYARHPYAVSYTHLTLPTICSV